MTAVVGEARSTGPLTYASTELDALAQARNYYARIMGRFRPHLGPRVVEVGAGVGTFSELLRRERAVSTLELFEPANNNFPVLQDRFAGVPCVRVRHGYFEHTARPEMADSIVLVNVLEHIEDDRAFFKAAYEALSPGGSLLIFVPAIQGIFGTLDEAFAHFRRYSKKQLGSRLTEAGFTNPSLRYMNLPGVLAWFFVGRVLKRTTLDAQMVTFYDRWVIPPVLGFEQLVAPPIGQNLLAIAHK